MKNKGLHYADRRLTDRENSNVHICGVKMLDMMHMFFLSEGQPNGIHSSFEVSGGGEVDDTILYEPS